MSELAASRNTHRPLWARLILTVLLTVIVGPLVGTIVVLIARMMDLAPGGLVTFMEGQPKMALLFQGYEAGGVQAFICGLAFAAVGWLCGRLPIWVPVIVALALALLFKLVVFGVSGGGIGFSVIIHIVPALATWWLARKYWQRREA